MSGEVSPEKFLEVYDYIMSSEEDKHAFFMFVDLHRKPNHEHVSQVIHQLCRAYLNQ